MNFIPHRFCYLNDLWLMLTMVSCDLILFTSYMVIGLVFYWIARTLNWTRGWMFHAFGTFTMACGLGHLVDVWMIWSGKYWVSASVRFVTAAASVGTTIAILQVRAQLRTLLETPRPPSVDS